MVKSVQRSTTTPQHNRHKKKILDLVWTNQNYKVKLKKFTAVKSNLVYKCKSACVLCSVWSQVVEIRGENISALMINAPIRLPIYPSIHPSPPPTLHPPGTPSLDYSTNQGPPQRGPRPPLPAQKWIILLLTPVSAKTPCCTLLCWKKKIPRGVTAAPPARLHLRTRAVKLDSNCINGGLCLPVGFFILSLSLSAHFTRFKGRKEEEGKKSSSLRVCGLASFMSCDHGCPSLHWVCVQIGGEESQNERVLAIMCMRECVSQSARLIYRC